MSGTSLGPRNTMRQLAEAARDAARVVGSAPRAEKDAVLLDVAAALAAQERELLEASARDVAAAEASGLSRAKLAGSHCRATGWRRWPKGFARSRRWRTRLAR
jgi:hypothetical protein